MDGHPREAPPKLVATQYWVRMGMRVEGPLSIAQVRARASGGSLSRVALLSTDKRKWTVAAKVGLIFRSDGTVNTAPVIGETLGEELEPDFGVPANADDEGSPMFAVVLPLVGLVRVEWVLAPAWCVIFIAGLLPVARLPGDALFAFDLPGLFKAAGWQGVVAGSAWIASTLVALVALVCAWRCRGARRALAGLASSAVIIVLAVVAFACGSARGAVSALDLVIVVFAIACIDAARIAAHARSTASRQGLINTSAAATFTIVGVISIMAMFVTVAVKGAIYLIAGGFVVAAGGSIAIAGILAGGEQPKREPILWLCAIALVASCLAVLAEAITVTAMGGPRLATFDAIRALVVVSMATICAYLANRERLEAAAPESPPPPLDFAPTEEPSDADANTDQA